MTLRIEIDSESLDELSYIINKNVRSILGNTKLVGAANIDNWESNLTEEALLSQLSGDNQVSSNDNLVNFDHLNISNKMIHVIKRIFPENRVEVSGFFHYPKTGYMSWHTNSDVPCKRLYITWAKESNSSFFRYYQDNNIITDYDDKGLTLRLFDIKDKPPYLWHCVGSNTDRISFGFRIR